MNFLTKFLFYFFIISKTYIKNEREDDLRFGMSVRIISSALREGKNGDCSSLELTLGKYFQTSRVRRQLKITFSRRTGPLFYPLKKLSVGDSS